MILDTVEVHLKTDDFTCVKWNYFFSSFFTDQNLTLIKKIKKISYGHVTKIPRDDGLLSERATEVNGNDP